MPGFDIFSFYKPAKEVGGDYYDVFPIDSENLALVVADVSGKGIPGCMVMATTRLALRLVTNEIHSPIQILTKTNEIVAREIKRGMFVTVLYGILNIRTRQMTVVSAGHNPMVVYRGATKKCELVNPSGIAVGFDKGSIFNRTVKQASITVNRGDRIVMYTDGVVEAMNERNEEWGDKTFYRFTMQNATLSSEDFIKKLTAELEEHKGTADQHDDITILTFRVN